MEPETPTEKRTDNDIDSIVCGSPSKKQIKLYFNSRTDSETDLAARIELAARMAKKAEELLG